MSNVIETLRVPVADQSGSLVKTNFIRFLQTFTYDDENLTSQQRFLCDYVAQINSLVSYNGTTVFVDFQHLVQHDFELSEAIEIHYYRFEPYLRLAIQEVLLIEDKCSYVFDTERGQKEFFVAFYNKRRVEKIRSMKTEKIGKLISISGTVTRSSEVRPELLYGTFICKKCSHLNPGVEQQYQFTRPHVCQNAECTSSDFQLVYDECTYVDWQRLRVQENADEIPAGSMPRCIDVICRNEVVETAKAGDKVIFTGAVVVVSNTSGGGGAGESVVQGKTSGRGDNAGEGVSGLKRLGVKEMTYRMLFVASSITHIDDSHKLPIGIATMLTHQNNGGNNSNNDMNMSMSQNGPTSLSDTNNRSQHLSELDENDKIELLQMLQTPHLYAKMVESMCPGVFGHHEVKRGILLMLFGGVHKKTPEGISLRGDINTCIVGDPSCAKSQFLKYVHEFLPHSVYTSGKSSSAAGLTASVVRDHETGEYCIEAGALMLADNGICCIDEFDKMDSSDQVAIHEAMEQQTISITKAGIQATLNARTSILAAANPVFGRYDRTKTLKANVTISAPIMSRFDLFFVILDECNPVTDDLIARHIIHSHRFNLTSKQQKQPNYPQNSNTGFDSNNNNNNSSSSSNNNNNSDTEEGNNSKPFTMQQLQKYIKFARSINPVITKQSRHVLVECYRLLRQNDMLGKNKTAYRITVRQLESLVRLSEALARLHLSHEIQPAFVREAYRLLQKSIIFVETEDIDLDENEEEMELLEKQVGKLQKNNHNHNNNDDDDNDDDDDDGGDSDNNGDDDNNNDADDDDEGPVYIGLNRQHRRRKNNNHNNNNDDGNDDADNDDDDNNNESNIISQRSEDDHDNNSRRPATNDDNDDNDDNDGDQNDELNTSRSSNNNNDKQNKLTSRKQKRSRENNNDDVTAIDHDEKRVVTATTATTISSIDTLITNTTIPTSTTITSSSVGTTAMDSNDENTDSRNVQHPSATPNDHNQNNYNTDDSKTHYSKDSKSTKNSKNSKNTNNNTKDKDGGDEGTAVSKKVLKKRKIQIPAKDYEDMTQMLALHLKRTDDLNAKNDTATRGCLWSSLLEWYLQQCEQELVNLEAFETKKKIVNQVIKRMIKHDGIVIVVDDVLDATGDQEANEKKYLQLHPSYEP